MFDPPSITAILHNDVPTLGDHAVVLLVTPNPLTPNPNLQHQTLNPQPYTKPSTLNTKP